MGGLDWNMFHRALALFAASLIAFACSEPPTTPTTATPTPQPAATMSSHNSDGDGDTASRDFALDDLQWEHRPLLVFAPSHENEAYLTQLERIEATTQGMRERDMTLTRIVGDEGTHEGEPISPASAGGLREMFHVERSAFAVILVGKDGGEKLRREEPVAMGDIFSLIDSMPMRQQEMRERE